MYKTRAIEELVRKVMKQFPAVLVTGPRQVGKSTLLKQVAGDRYEFFTMDDLLLREQIENEPALFLKNHPGNLVLDEIQYVPEIFSYLKMQIDAHQQNGQYLMTGSQAFPLMKGVSESLAGRVAILELQGISLREKFGVNFHKPFLPNKQYLEEREKCLQSYGDLWEIIHRGYMPRLVFHPELDWEIYYSSYVQTYIERDVKSLTQVADESAFLKLMVALAARTGQLLNYSALAGEVGVSNDTIKRWISILETSRLVYLMQPYANNHLTRALKTPKIFFLDTGLAAYLTRWPQAQTLREGAVAGNFFESFVISEIIKSYLNAGKVSLPLYYYRDKDQREIDLVIEQGDELYPIEIKMTASPNVKMAGNFAVLNAIPGKRVMPGVILCRYDRKLFLREDLISLPVEFI